MDEKYLRDVPDDLDDDAPDDIKEIHRKLKMKLTTFQRRRQEQFEARGILLDPGKLLEARMELLVQFGLGFATDVRLNFETAWIDMLSRSLEVAVSESDAKKREMHLHLPNGRIKGVPNNGN